MSRRGSSERSFANRGGSDFRGSSRYGEPLDGACGTRRRSGTESTASRKASRFAIDAAPSSHEGALYDPRLSGPVELSVLACYLDLFNLLNFTHTLQSPITAPLKKSSEKVAGSGVGVTALAASPPPPRGMKGG